MHLSWEACRPAQAPKLHISRMTNLHVCMRGTRCVKLLSQLPCTLRVNSCSDCHCRCMESHYEAHSHTMRLTYTHADHSHGHMQAMSPPCVQTRQAGGLWWRCVEEQHT